MSGSFSFQKIKSGGQEPAFADEMCEMCPKLTFQQVRRQRRNARVLSLNCTCS